MATYNAVVGLLEDLEHYLRPYNTLFRSWSWCPFTKIEIQILHDSVRLMDSLLRDSSGLSYCHELIDQVMESRIRSTARKAGNYLDLWALKYSNKRKLMGQTTSLSEITQEIVSINQELNKQDQLLHEFKEFDKSSTWLSPVTTASNTAARMVGLENELVAMLDSLTGQPSQIKVLSIIGMAGIGKTTFAKKLYDNPLVVHHFYARAWVTISQQFQVRKILLSILHCITNDDSDEIQGRSDEEVREKVYRILKHKRYLLVLDDMWDTAAWDDLKRTFPDDKNGSRIILTSRLREVAVHASEDTPPHCLRFLSIHESWELLSSKIFVDESCPQELLEIGKKIACQCRGLPLTIVVVGGLLSKMDKKLDIWEQVAQTVGSLVMEQEEHCRYVVGLSYNHLPDCLKSCFLYMAMFPEDYEISVKELIWLWVAEGFIRQNTSKNLEEVAEEFFADLTARSLILIKRRGSDGKIKTCYIHDLMRDFKAHSFFHVINDSRQLPLKDEDMPDNGRQRLSFHSSIQKRINHIGTSFPYTRSLMCFEKLSVSGRRHLLSTYPKLLKVLKMININLLHIPWGIWHATQLKFLSLTVQSPLKISSLSRLSLLQTVIIDCEWGGYLNTRFWDMPQLRHFHLKRACLSYSSTDSQEELDFADFLFSCVSYSSTTNQSSSVSVLEPADAELPLRFLNNLRSVSTVRPISCTEKNFLSMPHLKKLGIYETEEDHQFRGWFEKLVLLEELEVLKYVFSNPFVSSAFKPDRLPSWATFPPELVKVTMSGTSFPWEDMFILSMLPKLEVLKLKNYAFSGSVWRSKEGGFRCLKYLLIGSTNLEAWEADGTHFPQLQHLVLRHCRYLKEIPYGIFLKHLYWRTLISGTATILQLCLQGFCKKNSRV